MIFGHFNQFPCKILKFFFLIFDTGKELRNEIVARRGAGARPFSVATARRRLHADGLTSRRARRKPHLTPDHRAARLRWARIHRRWARNDWRRCLFTDESRFSLVPDDQTRRVWRRSAEDAHLDQFVNRRELFGGGGILVWGGGMTWEGKTDLVVIRGNLNGQRYRDEILEGPVRLFAGAMGPANMILVDDNARPHRNRIADQFFDDSGIARMDWPAKSPDMNPIENVWGLMKRRISRRLRIHHNLNDLEAMVREEWDSIPMRTVRSCINSMRRRAEAVIVSAGGHTDN